MAYQTYQIEYSYTKKGSTYIHGPYGVSWVRASKPSFTESINYVKATSPNGPEINRVTILEICIKP